MLRLGELPVQGPWGRTVWWFADSKETSVAESEWARGEWKEARAPGSQGQTMQGLVVFGKDWLLL